MRQHAQLRNDIGIFKTRGHGNVMYESFHAKSSKNFRKCKPKFLILFIFTVSFHLINLSPDFKFQVKISIFGRVMANSIFTDHIELVSDGDIK